MTLASRYENAGFDSGTTSLTSSTLTGGEVGVQELQYDAQLTARIGTVTGATITGASSYAIQVASDMTAGDKRVQLTATKSTFDGSATGGVANQSTSIITVTDDWWGDATGPSVWGFGTGSPVSSDVNFFPWATDSGFVGMESCTMGNTQTTATADTVLCALSGTGNAFLQNTGPAALLIGNGGNDQLVGNGSGETWMIGGRLGHNTFNGGNGTGYIQERGDPNDTLVNAGSYTIAAS